MAGRYEPVDGSSTRGRKQVWCGDDAALEPAEDKDLHPARGGSPGGHRVTDAPGVGRAVVAVQSAEHAGPFLTEAGVA